MGHGAEQRGVTLRTLDTDIVIIGSGPGGATVAYALRQTGAQVLILERGGYLPREVENWSSEEVFVKRRYKANEVWEHGSSLVKPGNHYYVGGSTKVFGACLARFRQQDFEEYGLEDGVSPQWPISYEELEPYYGQAERLYKVRGVAGEDPMEPYRSSPFPYPPLSHEPVISNLASKLREQGLHPYALPMGVNAGSGGNCILCRACDNHPCPLLAKNDAEVCCVRPALEESTVRLETNAFAEKLLTDPTGKRVVAADTRINGEPVRVTARKFVVAAGAANSAALFLRSANATHPLGLANRSDQVGRNYIAHLYAAVLAVDPRKRNTTVFQKTLGLNDFYLAPSGEHPRLGSLQTVGKVDGAVIRSDVPWLPRRIADTIGFHSVDWWLMTEDTPLPENRVTLGTQGRIHLEWRPTNVNRSRQLVRETCRMMRRAGYPMSLSRQMGLGSNAHQASTLRMGKNPETSVVDRLGKTHDLENVYVADASWLPSLGFGPGGPTLTVIAQALRLANDSDLTVA
jgi:choline dehydrogenase-like flavoprotein